MVDRNINIISINDVVDTLRDNKGHDWNSDDAFAFASDLTGLSVDALAEMVYEQNGIILKDAQIGQKYRDSTFGLDWECVALCNDGIILQNKPPYGAKVRIGEKQIGSIQFVKIQ